MKLIVIFGAIMAIAVLASAKKDKTQKNGDQIGEQRDDTPLAVVEPSPDAAPSVDNSSATADDADWDAFVAKFNKNYPDQDETDMRKGIFIDNNNLVKLYQDLYSRKEVTFQVEINEYSDLTSDELQLKYNGFWRGPALENPLRFQKNRAVTPPSMDWRETPGVISPVKTQGECGSCWAIVATDSIQSHSIIKTGKPANLSAQQVLDCADLTGAYGCDGGWIDSAYKYIQAAGGLQTEEDYPYVGQSDGTCKANSSNAAVNITRFVDLEPGREDVLKDAVAQVGPVAVAVDGSKWSFQHYAGGVYYEPLCSGDVVDRSLLIVGYGTEDGDDYWLAKNSMGTNWGIDGYIKIARNKKNHCGIANEAVYPVIA